MQADVLVIGGGLSGVIAAKEAKEQGKKVLLIRKGYGATSLSSGAFDLAYNPLRHPADPLEGFGSSYQNIKEIIKRNPEHPYSIISEQGEKIDRLFKVIEEALDSFFSDLKLEGISFSGSLERPALLTNSLGTYKFASFAPQTIYSGNLLKMKGVKVVFVGIKGLSEFNPKFLSQAYSQSPFIKEADFTFLNLPSAGQSLASPFELAKRFDNREFTQEIISELKRVLAKGNYTHLALPPVLGLKKSEEIKRIMEEALGLTVFETLSSLPSVPGLRLQEALDNILKSSNIEKMEGEVVSFKASKGVVEKVGVRPRPLIKSGVGRVFQLRQQKRDKNVPPSGEDAGSDPTISAKAFILTTGKYVGGGIRGNNKFCEPVFNLPVFYKDKNVGDTFVPELLREKILSSQPVFSAGIKVNSNLQPLDESKGVLFKNLYAAGSVLGGYDYIREKCGLGVALLTGYLAGKG